ncbi:MAG: bifunctional serine/threonine-protein kinase/formylglycine-generating enzyme family protein, partial [Planctomycetota bacterium]
GQGPQIGSVLGPYRIVGMLGEGGMASVYLAEDMQLKRPVALKVLAPHLQRRGDFARRFLREARAAARVSHPHVVSIYGFGEEQGVVYMAQEYLAGGDLDSLIDKKGPLGPKRAVRLIRQCADGLQALHKAKLIHRDIKPHNVFLSAEGQAKLGDLGLARQGSNSDITVDGAMIGTPAYMSPEQVRGEACDIRSDIHALGATLFTLVSGQKPFKGDNTMAVLAAITTQAPPDLRQVRSRANPSLAHIISTAMAKDPELRYRDPATMVAALDMWLQSDGRLPAPGHGPARPPARRHVIGPRTSIALAVAAVVVLTWSVLRTWGDDAESDIPERADGPRQQAPVPKARTTSPGPAQTPVAGTPDGGTPPPPSLAAITGPLELERGSDEVGPWIDLRRGPVAQRFRRVAPGSFRMGSPDDERDRGTDEGLVNVTLTTPCWIGQTECTRAFYHAVVGGLPSGEEQLADDVPVAHVSWNDARELVARCNQLLDAPFRVRLPSEAQWEYACRAGTAAAWSCGAEPDALQRHANAADASSDLAWAVAWDDGFARRSPVASYAPNAWGLYDMHGNVWEWCRDAHRHRAASQRELIDPVVESGRTRVRRGGSWEDQPRSLRSAERLGSSEDTRRATIGLRLVLEPRLADDAGENERTGR